MNKYLVCLSVVAFCFSLTAAVTWNELERTIHQVNSAVRVHENIAIQNASRDALTKATTPQEKVCIATKIGPAFRDLNKALTGELLVVQNECKLKTPEQVEELDELTLIQDLFQRYLAKSTAQRSIDQINQCLEPADE